MKLMLRFALVFSMLFFVSGAAFSDDTTASNAPAVVVVPVVANTNGITGNLVGSFPNTIFSFIMARGELHTGAGLNLQGEFGTVVSQQLTLFNFGNTNTFSLKNGPAAATFIYSKTEEQLGWSTSWKLFKVDWLDHAFGLNLSEINGFVYAGLPVDELCHPTDIHAKRLTVSAGLGWAF
jgi:hypothetical protein